ncbi:MAG: 23S rRNA (guanosine(2251)-2'-O)-methyltransferase RlmB [Nitrospiraceae bacterium]|nr:MAG: 23S rRNA (guanosine(2251)-2'-O)-methyltransferase RlmB [Nitrospiraceae bacterium]
MGKNRMYLYGKNSVLERLRVNPIGIRQVFLQDNFNGPALLDLIRSHGIPHKRVSEKELLKIKRADRLQGIVAEVNRYQYTPFDALLRKGLEEGLSLIFLDSLNDPHNLGSIIRTTACFGGFAVVIPEHGSCEVNETVVHVASGGENYVPASQVINLSQALLKAKKAGYWAVGTVVEGGQNVNRVSLPFPLCLVLGAEGKGIRYGMEKNLDLKVTLPMMGAQLSLNVAMACAIFAHEIARQRGRAGAGPPLDGPVLS